MGVAVGLLLVFLAVLLGLRGTGSGPVAESTDARVAPGAGVTGKGYAGTAPSLPSGAGATADGSQPQARAGASAGSSDSPVITPKVSRTAWLGIKVTDLAGAAAKARVVATEAGGQVTSENVVTSVDPTGGPVAGPLGGTGVGSGTGPVPSSGGGAPSPGVQSPGSSVAPLPDVGVDQARLVLNVPAKALDVVLTQLSRLGTVSYRSSQSQDVTDTYVDTRSRIQPMRDGIDRLRALLAKTTDLQQVITLEDELSRRQADLDSLTQRLAQLDALTTTSDVTVSMWTDTTPVPVPAGSGFTGGLSSAWDSLLGSLTVVLTGLAALLPWLVVGVPLALLALRLWRRHRSGPSVSPSATPSATPSAAPSAGQSATPRAPTSGTSGPTP